jgi:hypothetical protein
MFIQLDHCPHGDCMTMLAQYTINIFVAPYLPSPPAVVVSKVTNWVKGHLNVSLLTDACCACDKWWGQQTFIHLIVHSSLMSVAFCSLSVNIILKVQHLFGTTRTSYWMPFFPWAGRASDSIGVWHRLLGGLLSGVYYLVTLSNLSVSIIVSSCCQQSVYWLTM